MPSPAVSILEGWAPSGPGSMISWGGPGTMTQTPLSQQAPLAVQAPVISSPKTNLSRTGSLTEGAAGGAISSGTWYGSPRSPSATTPLSQHTPSAVQSPVITSPTRQRQAREYHLIIGLRQMAYSALQVPGALSRPSGDQVDQVAKQPFPVAVPVCVLTIVALAVALVALRLLWFPAGNMRRGKRCETYACRAHASELGAYRERSAEPCEDFGRFVCSGWPRIHIAAHSVSEQAMIRWTDRVADPARWPSSDANRTRSVAHRALTMASACLSHDKLEKADILVEWMRLQELAFPDERWRLEHANYREELRKLAVLAVHWRLPLWFDLKLVTTSPGPGGAKRIIHVTPSKLAYVFWRIHARLKSEADKHDSYTRIVSSIVYRDEAWQGGLLERSAEVQSSILGNLSEAAVGTTLSSAEPWLGDVKHLSRFVAQLNPDDWLHAFQSAFDAGGSAASSVPVRLDDQVFVTDARLLNTMESLLAAHSPSDIAAHTSWWVAQILSPLALQAVFDSARAIEFFGAMAHTLMCAIQVESVYNVLFAVLDRDRLSTEERASIALLFERLRAAAFEKVFSSSSLRDAVQDTFAEVVVRARAVFWPEDSGNSSREDIMLRNLYGDTEPRSSDSFMQNWLYSHRALHRSVGTATASDASTSVFSADYVNMASHDPFRGMISLWTAVLEPPYYAEGGTSAMRYGGLGFLYARELFRLANVVASISANDSGMPRPWAVSGSSWQSDDNSSTPAVEECLEEGIFPDLPALMTAHEAYIMYRKEEYDVPLSDLDNYTPEQVFFMTVCHTHCQLNSDNTYAAERCTVAMRNYGPFATAFGCVRKSPMYPAKRCVF
ncbi:hypothetical protein HPB50_024015 [Hyalomma asiaticum]|uniref:Uncharacterized protein n=1 Tax=Hyalomma asiaticum TaxID=266040 RepID=A0ACB7SZA0_HYAAI|nr:hypothetical protein HPB50_024015 [Hyalomma asiaticum]